MKNTSIRSAVLLGTARAALCVMLLSLTACGITASRGNDGFANLDSPGMNDTHRVMALSFGPTVLRFAAKYIDDEPETQELLRTLDGVRVRIYEVTGDQQVIARNFERMGAKLEDDGWQEVMLVREEGELVQMFAKSDDQDISGLTVLVVDDEDVVVVNLMGNIQPQAYSNVMLALDVDDVPVPDVQLASID